MSLQLPDSLSVCPREEWIVVWQFKNKKLRKESLKGRTETDCIRRKKRVKSLSHSPAP
jgi:hypothetical protein